MTLRSVTRQSVVTVVAPRAHDLEGLEALLAPQKGWLWRQHMRFARSWGRGWAWRETPRPGRTLDACDGEARAGSGGFADAYMLAARHLAASRAGARPMPWLFAGADPARLLLPPALVARSEDVSACVETVLRAGDRVPERPLFAACTLLAEMAQNVCEHSAGSGCVAVSWTPEATGRGGTVSLGIVDAGIGIHASLALRIRNGDLALPCPEQALVTALKQGAWPGHDRGTGFCMSRQLVERHGGVLHLRSGDLILTLGAGETLCSRCPRRFAAVAGTQISIRLRVDGDASHDVTPQGSS